LCLELPLEENGALIGGLRRSVSERKLYIDSHKVVREVIVKDLALRGSQALMLSGT